MRGLLRKIERSLRRDGVASTLNQGARVAGRFLGDLRPSRRTARRRAARLERMFDAELGITTDTRVTVPPADVDSGRWALGHSYVPLNADFDFGRVLSGLELDFAVSTFVDIGSGMGRALFIAARLPFKALVGVEYSASLCSIALDNLRRSTSNAIRAREITIVHADAVEYELPAGPLVIFFYNPFDCVVMAEFARRVEASFRSAPRRITLVYLTPRCAEVWRGVEFLRLVSERDAVAVFDTRPELYAAV